MEVRYIIVGKGLAGSLIAFQCIKRSIPFIMVDLPGYSTSSQKAAGIINPLTGRKFVKTWIYEELYPAFLSVYREMEQYFDSQYLRECKIIRALQSVKDQNNWDVRKLTPEAESYMHNNTDISDYHGVIHEKMGYGHVDGFQLNIPAILNDITSYLMDNQLLLEEKFDFEALKMTGNTVQYKSIKAEGIIFCEGFRVVENPFFKSLPFDPSKGEVLKVDIPNLETNHLMKDGIFVAPVFDDYFWVGSNYKHGDLEEKTTAEGREWLENNLNKIIKSDYEIKEHVTAVRPSTKRRKPLIGTHPEYRNIHLFNGLGTKGSSLGPYFSIQFMDYLEGKGGLNEEVDVSFQW